MRSAASASAGSMPSARRSWRYTAPNSAASSGIASAINIR